MTFISQIEGKVAHDAADSGNPVKIGGYAAAAATERAAVANADRVDFIADAIGKQIVMPFANPELFGDGFASATGTANTQVLAAAGASIRWYVTGASVWNRSATNSGVELKDGSTTRWVFAAPARGGSNHQFSPPLKMTANTAVNFAATIAMATAYVSLDGYKGA